LKVEKSTDCLILGYHEGTSAFPHPILDEALDSALQQAIGMGDFDGKLGKTLLIYTQGKIGAARVLLVGLGTAESFTLDQARIAAAATYHAVDELKGVEHCAFLPFSNHDDQAAMAQMVAEGLLMAAYRSPQYRREDPTGGTLQCTLLGIEGEHDPAQIVQGLATGEQIVQGVTLARDLVSEPGNILYPVEMAERARAMADECGLKCTLLGEAEMSDEGMGLLLAVSQGSIREAQMIILEHAPPGKSEDPPIILVGKGVTFDTGGISLKGNDGMWRMKGDMGGAAAVIGTMQAIAQTNVDRRVIGVTPCVENMPDAAAYRPGDILTGITGKTAEIISTDAEGRLILADALGYIARYEPCAVVDLATLTGAVVVALGSQAAGLFSNDDNVRDHLLAAAENSGERLWPMPLYDEYMDAIKSDMAEVKNSGGRSGVGSSAKFLEHFTEGYPWAHLDIAGVSWSSTQANEFTPKGATGFGVRLLVDFVENFKMKG